MVKILNVMANGTVHRFNHKEHPDIRNIGQLALRLSQESGCLPKEITLFELSSGQLMNNVTIVSPQGWVFQNLFMMIDNCSWKLKKIQRAFRL